MEDDLRQMMKDSIRQTLLDAIAMCDNMGNREDMKKMIQEHLDKMDEMDSGELIALRESKIDEILKDESEENKMG
jgi:predicted aldo/keto reductase-like oxidoreductase